MSTKDLQANSNALRVCPFCGGEAELVCNDIGVFVGCFHENCPIGPQTSTYLDGYATEAEAIAAWNTRADYHGYEQAAIEAWESIKAWNARADTEYGWSVPATDENMAKYGWVRERTCEFNIKDNMNETEGMGDVWIECSACHCVFDFYADEWLMKMSYCPNCGRKVMP